MVGGYYQFGEVNMLEVQPVDFDEACEFIERYHRHHRKPQGFKYCIGINDGSKLVGVAIVGRPVARNRDDVEIEQ